MIQVVKSLYSRIKKYIIYVSVTIVILSEYIELPQYIQTISVLSLGVMIVELLFDINEKVSASKNRHYYNDFYEVSLKMKNLILHEIKSKKKLKIRVLGMSMGHAWQFLYNTLNPLLTNNNDNCCVVLQIAMLDPNWTDLKEINPYWIDKAVLNEKIIKQYIQLNQDRIANKNWEIQLYLYKHMPNWHGILVGEDYLYLSKCSWKDNVLQGGESAYEKFDGSVDAYNRLEISHFINWFDKISKL
ncbi:hypothetical protein ACAW74_24485 [Fibrella sp. WM1]|uniref:hypothetical protein n=1 Tax=Fibrella musci TaxID=3242485 RepID=UPI003520E191